MADQMVYIRIPVNAPSWGDKFIPPRSQGRLYGAIELNGKVVSAVL